MAKRLLLISLAVILAMQVADAATTVVTSSAGTAWDGSSAITGTGSIVAATSPTLVTPTLGAATATSVFHTAGAAPGAATSGVQAWQQLNTGTISFVDSALTANNRIADIGYNAGGFLGRFVNDAYSSAVNWMVVSGGSGGVTAISFPEHIVTGGAAPACGTGCASVTGNDNAFVVTAGSAVTSVAVSFGASWGASPVCNVSSNSTASTTDISAVSASAVTFGASVALTGALLYVNCRQ